MISAHAAIAPAGSVILTSPQAIRDVARSIDVAIEHQRRVGHTVPPRVLELRALFTCALHDGPMSAAGRTSRGETAATGRSDARTVDAAAAFASPEQIGVVQAAALLNLSARQVRRLAPALGGQLVGGRWVLDRHVIENFAQLKERQ